MTNAELIAKLQEFPLDITITVSGYEGGVSEKFSCTETLVIPNANNGVWYFGEHEPDSEGTLTVLNIG